MEYNSLDLDENYTLNLFDVHLLNIETRLPCKLQYDCNTWCVAQSKDLRTGKLAKGEFA